MSTSFNMNEFLLYPNTENVFPIYKIDKDIESIIRSHPEWMYVLYHTCYKLYLHRKLTLNFNRNTNTIEVAPTSITIPNIIIDPSIEWVEERQQFKLKARRTYPECYITGEALLMHSLHVEMCQLDPLDHKINLAIMTVAIKLGIVTSPFKQEKPEDFQRFIFEFVPMKLASLTKENQIKFYEMCMTQKPILITGSTGIGKTIVFPLLVWRYDLFNTGYEKTEVLSSPTLSSIGTLLAVPRKVMASKAGRNFLQNMGYEHFENSFIKILFQNVPASESNSRIRNIPTPFFVVVDALAGSIHNINSYIFDEIHEHSLFTDIYMAVFLKMRKRVVLITATIEKELKTLREKIPSLQHIHIEGPTRFKIEEIEIKSTEMINYIIENQRRRSVKIVFCSSEKRCQHVAENIKKGLQKRKEYEIDVIVYTRKIVNNNPELLEMLSKHDKCLVVVATNILESSVTIDRATEVYDFGNQYMAWFRQGKTVNISVASYLQRKGRVGRVQNGKYYRMYNSDNLADSSASINSNYLTTLLIFLNSYKAEPKDLIVSIDDLTRVEKTYKYYLERGVDLRKQANRLITIMKKYPCVMNEYIIIYLLGNDEDIRRISAIDFIPDSTAELEFLQTIKSELNAYRRIAQKLGIVVNILDWGFPIIVREMTNYEPAFNGILKVGFDFSDENKIFLLHPSVIV